jgi:penicillin-binding protein 1C
MQKIDKQLSTRIYDENHFLLRTHLSRDGFWRFKAEEEEIPALLKESVLAFEDRYFYYHIGVNPLSVIQAIINNLFHKRKIGASTISMQVARMMYHRKRTFANKIVEMFNALQLEWLFSKDEILKIYLNLAPYGGNIEGVKTAAWFYFKKPLNQLSISEIAILTTIPKNPNANRPDREKNLLKKRDRVLDVLLKRDVISKQQYNRAKQESLDAKKRPTPIYAPHFTQLRYFQDRGDIVSSLDMNLQRIAQNALKKRVEDLHKKSLHNGAVVVIDNKTMQIKAYVGSNNYFSQRYQGQNDGVMMIRSPGSALKPFIYSRAFDMGLTTPNQILYDLPLHINGYNPKNFNNRFMGEVSTKEALQYSLNIPAIELNSHLKNHSLYEMLKEVDIKSIDKKKSYYGDSIAIGGIGISLLDLTRLYSAYSNGGVVRSVSYELNTSFSGGVEIFSDAAGYITSEILSDGLRPEFSAYWDSSQNKPKIAFKTGTSAYSRDLLSVAYTPEYTIGVWMGNFDGKSTSDLTGILTASKVAFEIFDYLHVRRELTWFKSTKNVKQIKRCSDAIKREKCFKVQNDTIIEGVDIKRPCSMLRAEVLAYLFEQKGLKSISELKSNSCYDEWMEYKPLLVSPFDGASFVYNSELSKQQQKIPFLCYSFKQDKEITWIIDGNISHGVSAKQQYIYLQNSQHSVSCIDSHSSATTATFYIRSNE